MSLLEFDKWWWTCFNSFANNYDMTKADKLSVCYELLDGAGITKEEALHVLNKKDFLYGNAINVVNEYIINLDKKS